MKTDTLLIIAGIFIAYLLYKKSKSNTAKKEIESIVAQEPLYADNILTGESWYVPAGSIIKTFSDYYEITTSDTGEVFTIPIPAN